MNGCRSTFSVYDPVLHESALVACLGDHAPGEPHRAAGGRITWKDAEAYGQVWPIEEPPRLFTVPAEVPPPGTWSNEFPPAWKPLALAYTTRDRGR